MKESPLPQYWEYSSAPSVDGRDPIQVSGQQRACGRPILFSFRNFDAISQSLATLAAGSSS
jgi:hypothetical protein